MSIEDLPDDWRKIREAVGASPGWHAHYRIGAITRAYRILDRNAKELAKLLHFFDTPQALAIWDVEHPERLEAFLDEVIRCLHNFVASVRSLVDHTRNIMTEGYAGDPLLVEYQSRVESTFLVPFPQFVNGLRHYFLHYRLPATSATMNFVAQDAEDGEPKLGTAIVLERDDLLEWKGWNETARAYLTAAPAKIDFRDVVIKYLEVAGQFYEWLVTALSDKHTQDIADTNELIAQEHRLLGHYDSRRGA